MVPLSFALFAHLLAVDGICYGLPAGLVNVSIVVGACPGFSVPDSLTGWHASRSMWVYELNTVAITGALPKAPRSMHAFLVAILCL